MCSGSLLAGIMFCDNLPRLLILLYARDQESAWEEGGGTEGPHILSAWIGARPQFFVPRERHVVLENISC